jgi:hypothetical protein
MNRAIPLLVGLGVLATGPLAEAKTFRWVNDQGVVVYSDQPPQVRLGEKERDAGEARAEKREARAARTLECQLVDRADPHDPPAGQQQPQIAARRLEIPVTERHRQADDAAGDGQRYS